MVLERQVSEMKKVYEKPYACMETFEVSDFIAGNCEKDVGFGDYGSSNPCATNFPGFSGFKVFNDISVCEWLWDDVPHDDTGCYDIPQGGYGYFGS